MLEVHNINVSYGDVQVLWDVSFNVERGEIVALVGANGAGKTTTLKTISGLLAPTSGSMEFDGHRIEGLPPYSIPAYGIAHIPEGRKLFPEMTVLENLEIGSLRDKAKKKRKETVEWIFNLFPRLKERFQQLAGTLSGGEQQMLAIGRGLMSLPKLIMFDEPSLGLAPILVKKTFSIIQKIREKGVTVLLVEQNVRHTLTIAQRVYVLENGRIALEGEGGKLLNDPHVKEAYLGL
ncbi:MAG: ABC transporter ATP-binding protein [Thermodesulfobacteriota bacterium]